ncbi:MULTISPECIES: ribonuclease P protein component [unclassified Frankia]|uniref:ribonuclease P protein component n=1 Tax=unclassified Frankia TaxID=2632575 RepID=UPI002AD4FCBA|nr:MULTISPECIES: ribonuclease P protein component [unclassified Frankia]
MLPVRNRVRTRAEHAQVGRGGGRIRSGPLVVHSLTVDNKPEGSDLVDDADAATALPPPRVGFVVSRKVGNAVVRNRVRRRLREQVRARLDHVPAGTLMIVRALPDSATASSDELGRALDRALRERSSRGRSGNGSRLGDGIAKTLDRHRR